MKFSSCDSGDEAVNEKAPEQDQEKDEAKKQRSKWNLFEVGKDGKIKLNGKKIDLSKLTDDDLRALGIDPNLSAKEIAKRLKSMFGQDIQITQGEKIIGTKGLDEYDNDVTDEMLANDPDFDVDTCKLALDFDLDVRFCFSVFVNKIECACCFVQSVIYAMWYTYGVFDIYSFSDLVLTAVLDIN
ncbi:hypothetical protein ACF0H5_014180 [Mactra antiquata]